VTKSKLPQDFLDMSEAFGRDFSLVQGAGGNTSIKRDGLMHIKASGTVLSDANKKDIFVPVELSQDPYAEKFPEVNGVKPSIETSLHLLLQHKIVAHVHAASVIALAVLVDAKAALEETLSEFSWVFVPYCKPGKSLAYQVASEIQHNVNQPNVIILGNHGLVVGGNSPAEVTGLVEKVVSQVKTVTRNYNHDSFTISLCDNSCPAGFVRADSDFAHLSACDSHALSIVTGGTLYPDHVVFLKRGALSVMLGETVPSKRDSDLILIPNIGAYVPEGATRAAHEMAGAIGLIASQIPHGFTVNYLSQENEDELLNWDAEKYRHKLALEPN